MKRYGVSQRRAQPALRQTITRAKKVRNFTRGVTQEVLAGLLRRHDDEALAALAAARVAAPEQLMFTRRVHDMVRQMVRRDRRGRRELRELADFIGVG